MNYLLHILILICIYIILAVSLNIISGYGGLLSLAHAAFFGVGAYTAALLSLHYGTPFLANIIAAAVLAAVVGAAVGAPSLRLHGDYFILATFGLQIIIFSVMNNWVDFTGGPMGLPGIPQPNLFGWEVDTHPEFLALSLGLAALTFSFAHRLVSSPFGRVLKAVREDEVFAQSLGKNVAKYKLVVFATGAALASVAGVLYAQYITFIDPTSFTLLESIFILSVVIIGGAGNLWGSVVGAVMLVSIPELLRFVGMPSAIAANMRQILYGALLVLFMMYRPQGMIGEHLFRRR